MEPHHPGTGGELSRRGFVLAGAAAMAPAPPPTTPPAPASPSPATPSPATPSAVRPARSAVRRGDVPGGLLAGLLADPLGVGSASPRLWWQVPVTPGADGGAQTGYEVQLTRDARGFVRGARVESTGWVVAARSTAVAWPFAPLGPRSCGWWRVRTRHGAARRVTGWSAPQRLVRGPDGGDGDGGWAGATAIWAPAGPPPAGTTLRAGVTIRELRAGILVRATDDLRNGYLWQFTAATATAGSLLRPHVLVDGTYTLLAEVPLPAPLAAGRRFDVTVECRGDTVVTTVDGQVVDTRADARFAAGFFGVRTGNSESFLVDDVTVTDADGTQRYRNAFARPGDVPAYGTAESGALLVGRATTGLLDGTGPDHWALLRREFDLPAGTVAQAVLHATGQSPDGARQFVYRAWCNDVHAGVGSARSADAPRYQTHDVTAAVRAGAANVLALQCWTRSGKQVQALLDVHYTDGRRVGLVTDGTWQARAGGAWLPWAGDLSTPYYSAPDEAYDARHEPVGWRSPGYRGDDFAPAATGAALTGLVPAATVTPARRATAPASVTAASPRRWLVDTGQEIVGGLRLTLDVPEPLAGATVQVRLGEERNADGTVRHQLRAQTTYDERWTLRAGRQVIEHWGYRAFRWADLVTSDDLDLSGAVTLLEHVAPQPAQTGSFASSDPDLDRVWQLCAHTLDACRQDLFSDTPTRERQPYEGDLLTQARSQLALAPSYDLARQTARYLVRRPQWPAEFRFMTVAAAWEEYLETGDPDALDADFDLHRALQGDAKGWLNAAGLVEKSPGTSSQDGADLVDWPAGQRDGYVFTTVNTVVNAWQYQAFRCLQQAADATGRADQATRYRALADTLRAALDAACYDPQTGAYRDGPTTTHCAQHAAAYAASLGVTADAHLPAVAAWLASDAAHPVRVSANAAQWLVRALYLGGRDADALALLTRHGDASWLGMIEDWGATMTMEAWSPTAKPNTTFSHPWSAGPLALVARHLLGVQVTTPGAATVLVAPAPGGLATVEGSVATVRGTVHVDVEQRPGYRVGVDLPGNTTGTLRWPARGAAADRFRVVTSCGHPAPARVDGAHLVVALRPGRTEVTLAG